MIPKRSMRIINRNLVDKRDTKKRREKIKTKTKIKIGWILKRRKVNRKR